MAVPKLVMKVRHRGVVEVLSYGAVDSTSGLNTVRVTPSAADDIAVVYVVVKARVSPSIGKGFPCRTGLTGGVRRCAACIVIVVSSRPADKA